MGLEFFLGVRIVLIMFTRAHTNPFLLVCTSGFLWMAHIHLHISSLFGILPTYIHLCGMLLWVLDESNFKREVISETLRIRVIPLDLQLHRHVYFLIFFFFSTVSIPKRGEICDCLEPARRVICCAVIYIKHSTPFCSFSACSVLFVPTNDLMFIYSCGTIYFHGYGYPCLFSRWLYWIEHNTAWILPDRTDLLTDMAFLWLPWISHFCSHAHDSSLTNIAFPSESRHFFSCCCDFPQSCSCSFSAID